MNLYICLESTQNWQQAETMTLPLMNRAISQLLDSGAWGRVLLGALTNLALKIWACLYLAFSLSSSLPWCVQNRKYSNKTKRYDLEMGSVFASNQLHLLTTVVLIFVELKNAFCRLQKQGAEGSRLGCKLLLCSTFGQRVFYSGALLCITYLSVWVLSPLRRWNSEWLDTEQGECCAD